MARTPTVTREQVPEKYREAFDHEVAISRRAIENGPGSVMINSPEMRKRANHLVFYFRQESELPQKIQEMAMIMTARAKDCQYIWFAGAWPFPRSVRSMEIIPNVEIMLRFSEVRQYLVIRPFIVAERGPGVKILG